MVPQGNLLWLVVGLARLSGIGCGCFYNIVCSLSVCVSCLSYLHLECV